MLDHVTRLTLLEVVRLAALQDERQLEYLIWLHNFLSGVHKRWLELDERR